MHIYPKKRTYKATAIYTLVNKTNQEIDSIFLNHNSLENTFEFNIANKLVLEDTVFNFDIFANWPNLPWKKKDLHRIVYAKFQIR